MKKCLLSLALVGVLLGSAPWLLAKDTPAIGGADGALKPVAIISLSGYDRVMSDIAFIGQVAQRQGLEKQAEGMLMVFAQGLQGLDKTRPWGVVVSTDGTNFPRLGFLPVTNVKQLLASLQGLIGPADDAGGGVYSLETNNLKLYIKEQNGWAFISDTSDSLADLPKDPSKWLDGLDKKFELAVQFHVANVPEVYRTMAIDQMKDAVRANLKQQPGEDDSTFELRQKLTQTQMQAMEDIVNDADLFTFGWAIDPSARLTSLDVSMTGRTGTELAKKFASLKAVPSNFAGFTSTKAAFSAGVSQAVTKDDADQLGATLDNLKVSMGREIDKSNDLPDDATKTAAKAMLDDLAEAIKGTLASGKIDGGVSLLLGAKTLTGVAGLYVADPGRVENALKKLSELSAKDPNIPKIKFNSDKYGDVRFHTAKFPVPADEDLAKVVGSTLDVAVGIGPKSVYVGLGNDALSAAKKAIDNSKAGATKPVAPGFAIVSAQPIVDFANAMEPNPINQALAAELAKAPGKDHIQLTINPINNGLAYHLEIQEAVLNLIGVAAKVQSPNAPVGGGGGFGPPGGGNPRPQRVR